MSASREILTSCILPVALIAALASPASADMDAAAVQVLAGPCASCHGPDGRSPDAIPSIAGRPESALLARMTSFRDGSATDATVMTRLMRGYDDTQIAALAQWFAEIEQ